MEAPQPPKGLWQAAYSTAHRLRAAWHARRVRRLPRPVVSVGNLHWGGAGKTPVVAAIAEHLRDRGHNVSVLSRGYGRKDRKIHLVSSGDGPLLGPRLAGDEPVLLAGELPGISVLVGPDRYQVGRHALERLAPQPDLFLLDDGFSHLGLHRDVNLLLFPKVDPFGGGQLWPSGRLREPLSAIHRADACVLTGASLSDSQEFQPALESVGFDGPGFWSSTMSLPVRDLQGEPVDHAHRVLVVCAVARPEGFLRTVRSAGYTPIETLIFPDHFPYDARSLERIATKYQTSGADLVLTTAKDRVKLMGRVDVPLAELPIEARPEPEFWPWLDRALEQVETS